MMDKVRLLHLYRKLVCFFEKDESGKDCSNIDIYVVLGELIPILRRYLEIDELTEKDIERAAYALSDKESAEWWHDAMRRFDEMSQEEKSKYNQFIGFNDFSDVLLNKMAFAYMKGVYDTMSHYGLKSNKD